MLQEGVKTKMGGRERNMKKKKKEKKKKNWKFVVEKGEQIETL